jgi:hypothetical protein
MTWDVEGVAAIGFGCAAEEHDVVADHPDDAEGAAWRAGAELSRVSPILEPVFGATMRT